MVTRPNGQEGARMEKQANPQQYEGYTLKQHHSPTRDTYEATEPNSKGERLDVCMVTGADGRIYAETEIQDESGALRRDYNPQRTRNQSREEYQLASTIENRAKLMNEILKRFKAVESDYTPAQLDEIATAHRERRIAKI